MTEPLRQVLTGLLLLGAAVGAATLRVFIALSSFALLALGVVLDV